jgi:Tol biopolymer transport system component
MRLVRNPELRGVLILALIILVLGLVSAAFTGRLEQWFGITWFSGPMAMNKIIFVSDCDGHDEICLMNTNGSGRKQLATHVAVASLPAINAMGNRIVFIAATPCGESQVYQVGAGGGDAEQITASSEPKDQPTFSPDGTRIAYISSGRVYVAEPDGSNPGAVLPTREQTRMAMRSRGTDTLAAEMPRYRLYAWGADSKSMIAVARDAEGRDSIFYVPDLVAGDVLPVLALNSGRVQVADIAWAAKAAVAAFSVVVDDRSGVAVFDAKEGKVKPIAMVKNQFFGDLDLSPDGQVLIVATQSFRPKRPSGLIRFDLSAARVGLILPGLYQRVVFSPRGDKVLAVRVDPATNRRDIISVNPDGSNLKQLTRDGASHSPVWSPIAPK